MTGQITNSNDLFLQMLRQVKRVSSVIPTSPPRNSLEQMVYYENGSTRRLYLYIGNNWRYVNLT